MRVLTLCLGIGIILTAACSSSSGKGGAAGALPLAGQASGGVTALGGVTSLAGTTSAGGVAVLGGNTGSGTIPLTGNCANLTCLNPMVTLMSNPSCQQGATDTCTQSVTMGTGIVMNECYSSGVKMQASMSVDGTSMTMTVKGGGSVCYLMAVTGDFLSPGVMTMAIKDPSGATVATIDEDTSTTPTTIKVTCPGGTPTLVDSSCGSSSSSVASISPPGSSGTTCTDGVCTF
jgi:hypothetical protein